MSAESQYPKSMPYVNLGKSGLRVSKVILGCMTYGSKEWQKWTLGEEEAMSHIKAAYDAGIQSFDTADVYSNGVSEEILGKAIKKFNLPRDEIVVMTKLYNIVGRTPKMDFLDGVKDPEQYGYVNQRGLSRKHIFASVKKSLERLQLDYIDLLQCHRFDKSTPIEETMTALHDVVKAGYVRYIGMSSCYAWQFFAMQTYALQHGLTPFISMQNHYSLVYREEEREMFPALEHLGVGSIPWSPLAQGFLARPYTEQSTARAETTAVEELAEKKGYTMAQIAAAWVMNKDHVSAPIFGTTKLKNLEEIIAAVHIKLTPEEMKHLEEPYQPQGIIGHQ